MALEFILLGMLRDEASGYDIRSAFADGPRHFWSAELSQIYPALHAMQRRGLVRSRREPSPRGPARRVYRRTQAGTRALHRWLSDEPEMNTERLAYIGQLVFLGELRDERRTLAFLQSLRERLAASQKKLATAERALRREGQESVVQWDHDDFHELLCLLLGRRSLRAKVAACDECLALVHARLRRGAKT